MMKFSFLILLSIAVFTIGVVAQSTDNTYSGLPGVTLNKAITAGDLRQQIEILASDSLKGRKPGMPEHTIAAGFIRNCLKEAGLELLGKNGFQEFEVITDIRPGEGNALEIDGQPLELSKDFIPLSFSSNGSAAGAAAFVGYGFDLDLDSLKWNDYAGIDVKGKWAVILRGDPEPEKSNSLFLNYSQERTKVLSAKDKGAIGVILVTPSDMEKSDVLIHMQFDKTPADAGIPVINVTRTVANRLLSSMNYTVADLETTIKDNHAPMSILLPMNVKVVTDLVQQKVTACNVIGLLKGTDPVLSSEYIVIGAHFDHLGWGGDNSGSRVPEENAVHNGADDNASGTAGVIELAASITSRPVAAGRSILFVAFTAEEMGLLGSKEFVKNSPVDLKQIKCMINMDMIGRLNPESKTISVGGTGTSVESDTIIGTLSLNRPFRVNRAPDGYGPSDHASFYSENIPVFYFTTGAHEDYHTPGDDADKIDYEGEAAILDMIEDLALLLADSKTSLTFKEAGSKQGVRYGRNLKVTLGIVPDMVSTDNKGLRVDGVKKSGPAERSGILKGDVIIALDGQAVTNIYDYMARLGKIKPGQVTAVEIIRAGKKQVLIVQF